MIQPKASAKPSGYRWVVFCLLAFGYLLVYFHRLCPAVVALDMQADLQTSGALLGFLAAAYFYPYALMQLPSGLLSDSWGPRKTITVFFAIAGASSIFLGMVESMGLAILARTLVGLGVAMLFVPTMKVMTNWFKIEEFARMTGILMAV
ncbi:MAG: MFS transporter, partial [Gammaproteobacteria bacterium]|nr:MFS transporter [Gammaproteobacteria bacterium]